MNNIKLDIPDITVVVDSGYAISVDGSGSYFIVADTATSAITASYALTSSFAVSALTSSYALNATATVPAGTVSSSRQFNSLTLPFTGSFTGSFRGVLTGSTFGTASFAVSSSRAITSSFAITSSRAITASFVDYTNIANKPTLVSSSTQINTGSFTGSFIGTVTSASFATTASYVAGAVADWNTLANKPAGIVSSSTQINTGSFSGSITTASFATTASYALNATATVPVGTVSSSLQFNSLTLPFTGSFTGSFRGVHSGSTFGTASWANNVTSASFATTASAATSITFTPSTASFATTASYALNATATVPAGTVSSSLQFNSLTLPFTGSFTGSLIGTVTSASFATSASYAPGGGATFPYTGTAVISGSLIVSSSVTASAFKGDGSQLTNLPSSSVVIDSYTFVGNGSAFNYTLGNVYDISSLTVTVGGLTQISTTDYTLAGTTLSFLVAPPSQSNILVRALVNASVGVVGSFTGSLLGTASFATTASYALNATAIVPAGTVSSSLQFNSLTLPFTGSFTGSFIGVHSGSTFGTASWANNVTSASFATTASAATSITFTPQSASFATTASFALNASAAAAAGTVSSSLQFNSLTLPFTGSFTGSFIGTVTSASFATSASYAPGGGTTFPYIGTAVISGSLIVSSSVTASAFKGDGSQLTNLPSGLVVIDSYTFVGNGSVSNYTLSNVYDISSLIVTVGGLTQTSIIDYTLAGTNLSFLVAPASQSNILVRAVVNASTGAVGSFTGSLLGTASFATTASFALSASYAPGGGTTFPYTGTAVISGSLIVSSSVTASAFKGDGSQLTNLPSSSVVIDSYTFTGNGAASNYTLNNVYDISSLTVVVGGLTQTSIIDYTLAGTNLSFLVAPPSQSNILVRALVNTSVGVVGSFTGSFTGDGTGLTGVTATVFPYVGAAVISGSLTITGSNALNITGSATILGAFQATTKSFKIDHQRLLGKKLIYGVLEGPEHGVYVRGRLTKNNIIQLPEEWEWLVDSDSITVQLTPIAIQQALYVQNIENNTVIINSSTPIDCFYYVQATRKDVNTLQTVE
jgi:hypothetical protein